MTEQNADVRMLVEHIAKSLVDAPEQVFVEQHNLVGPLPFPLTSFIISVCLDLAGRFRNKDIHLC